jgi:hypothetical protein
MAQKGVIHKDGISEYVIANGQEVRPYYGTQFNEGDKVIVNHFAGSTSVGVGLDKEAKFRNGAMTGKYEVWCLSGVRTYTTNPDEPIPAKTLSEQDKSSIIKKNSHYLTDVLYKPYEVTAMDNYIAWNPGNRIYPYANITNLMYALSKCRGNKYRAYPELFDPIIIQTERHEDTL